MGSWSACPALIYDLMLLFWSRITLCIMFYLYSIFRECYSHGLHLFVCRVWRSCPIFIYICHPNLIHSSWPECPVFLSLPILLAEIGAMKHTHTGCICWLACWWGHDQSPPWQLSSSCLAPSLGGWGGVLDPCFEDKCKTSPFSSSSSSAIHLLFFG